MNLTQKLLDDLYHEIELKNKELSPLSIPHSDTLTKQVISSLGMSPENMRCAILLLCDAHRIFSMEIVAQDTNRGIDRVEGYIVANRDIISNLKVYFQDLLSQIYEKQFHKHLLVHQIIKEIFPIIKSFNNTDLGQVTNKTIMLMEYERLIEKDPQDFSDDYIEKKMIEIATREKITYTPRNGVPIVPPQDPIQSMTPPSLSRVTNSASMHGGFARAVDSPEYQDFAEKKNKYPIQRILNIYGIDFFIKVSMRKYQFDYLRQLVEDRQITKKEDLNLLKSTVEKVKANIFHDKELERNRELIYALERAVSHAIYFTHQPPPKKQ